MPSIRSLLKGRCHPDLLKKQAELGSQMSYRQASTTLKSLMGARSIFNPSQIYQVTKHVGSLIDKAQLAADVDVPNTQDVSMEANELIVHVDGGYVHENTGQGKNFEVMVAKIYRPEAVVRQDTHHTTISEKQCTGSAKDDEQATMKHQVQVAAKKAGMTKNTVITALADGASNCWSIITSLLSHCAQIILILDWFHIGKYIVNVKQKVAHLTIELDNVRCLLWEGKVDQALSAISSLLALSLAPDEHKVIDNFYGYIAANRSRIVDYSQRQAQGLIYSSHVAESTVDHFLHKRAKKKQKMNWNRDGLHAVLQIRGSIISGEWDNDWQTIMAPTFDQVA